ncbi:MAG: alkaline shock response membrane anchor protein AmaP [Antricoccus sp.]
MHADRTNRTVLTLLAIILLAAGIAGALLSYGVFGSAAAKKKVFNNPISDYIGQNGNWFWIAAAVLGLILAFLGLRWLIALSFSTDRVNELTVVGNKEQSRTTLTSSAITRALTEEVEAYEGIHSATARMIGDQDAPELVLEAVLEDTANLASVRDRIENEDLAHVRQALNAPSMPIIVDLSVTDQHQSRVS